MGNCIEKIVLVGRPITKKNSSQIIKCGNFHRIIPSKQFTKYQKDCLKQIPLEKQKGYSERFNMRCLYYMPTRHRVDLINLLEATCDILVDAGVLQDDNSSIVVSHDGSRVYYDKENPRVEIYLEEVDEV